MRLLRPLLLCVAVAVAAGACAPGGTAAGESVSERPPPREEAPPPIERGPIEPAAEGRAADLLREAREALAAGNLSAARDAAGRVVSDFPRASGSREALLILARASLGLDEHEEARAAASRYARLHTPEHARWGDAVLLEARALVGLEGSADAIHRLVESEPGLREEQVDEALSLVREHVRAVDPDRLAEILEAFPDRTRLVGPVLVEYAIALHFLEEREEGRRVAERALGLGLDEEEATLARAVLDGDPEGVLGSVPMIAAVLPSSGSPALAEFGRLIEEGVRLAVELDGRSHRVPVALEVADDAGNPERGAALARQLAQRGAFGLVGPLMDPAVDAAARGLERAVPLISPTARMLPSDFDGVYSLSSVDPNAALALARYAGEARLRRVAVVHPRTEEATEEARIFIEAFRRDHPGFVVAIPYAVGQTNFQQTMLEVEDLGVDALVLPLGPDEIEVFAPQISFYGLDSLNIQVLGTSAWALDDVLASVAARHTDGVIVATGRSPYGVRPEYEAFTDAYESFYQRSLVSRVPALGYDAAALLLEAIRRGGARSPADLRRALEGIRDFPGATGTLSVVDGRIVREHNLVRLEGRRITPLEWGAGP